MFFPEIPEGSLNFSLPNFFPNHVLHMMFFCGDFSYSPAETQRLKAAKRPPWWSSVLQPIGSVCPFSLPRPEEVECCFFYGNLFWMKINPNEGVGFRYNERNKTYIFGGGIYLEPADLYFWRATPQHKAFLDQNNGHLRVPGVYISYPLGNYRIPPWEVWENHRLNSNSSLDSKT